MKIAIDKTLIFLRKLEDALLVTLLLSMVGIATTQVLLRNLFDSGFYWGDSLGPRHCALGCVSRCHDRLA